MGVVLGFGGAIITDLLFIKFLGNLKVSNSELNILRTMSKVIWLGIFIIVTSGALLFLSDPEGYLNTPKFLAKMVIVLIIILNGLVLNFIVTPNLRKINFGKFKNSKERKMRSLRKLAFASGSISAVSWWSAFILGSLSSLPLTLNSILLIYFSVLSVAIISSQVFGSLVSSGKIKFPSV